MEKQHKSPTFETPKKIQGTQGNAPANGQIMHKVVQKCRKNNGKTPGRLMVGEIFTWGRWFRSPAKS